MCLLQNRGLDNFELQLYDISAWPLVEYMRLSIITSQPGYDLEGRVSLFVAHPELVSQVVWTRQLRRGTKNFISCATSVLLSSNAPSSQPPSLLRHGCPHSPLILVRTPWRTRFCPLHFRGCNLRNLLPCTSLLSIFLIVNVSACGPYELTPQSSYWVSFNLLMSLIICALTKSPSVSELAGAS